MHHRLVHEDGYRVQRARTGHLMFFGPTGLPLPDTPPPVRLPARPVEALMHENRRRGIEPDFYTSRARYKYDRDVPFELTIRALEALDPAGDDE